MIIYRATNKINGMVYIGQTIQTIDIRRSQHEGAAKNMRGSLFQHAINRYGTNVFEWRVIDTAENTDELNEKEVYWIKKYNSTNRECGYNVSCGGHSVYRSRRSTSRYVKVNVKKRKEKERKIAERHLKYVNILLKNTDCNIMEAIEGARQYMIENERVSEVRGFIEIIDV